MKHRFLLGLLVFLSYYSAQAADESAALFVETGASEPSSYVSIYLRDITFSTRNMCVVQFGFNGYVLAQPIEDLTFTVGIVGADGKKFGTGMFKLIGSFGGSGERGFAIGYFDGQDIPELVKYAEDEGGSPLCGNNNVSLIFESAIGLQSGKTIDLVRFGQLRYTKPPQLGVKIGTQK